MKVKLFWTEIEPQESYVDRDHGSLMGERFLLESTEPDLDTITLEDLEYLEAPLIERLPNETYFFSFNKLDIERIISRRPGENVLGIVLEDIALILNRGYLGKFNIPLPDIEFVHSTSYRHPPQIVQLIAGIHTTDRTWPEEHVTAMQDSFKKHKAKLLKMWGFNEADDPQIQRSVATPCPNCSLTNRKFYRKGEYMYGGRHDHKTGKLIWDVKVSDGDARNDLILCLECGHSEEAPE